MVLSRNGIGLFCCWWLAATILEITREGKLALPPSPFCCPCLLYLSASPPLVVPFSCEFQISHKQCSFAANITHRTIEPYTFHSPPSAYQHPPHPLSSSLPLTASSSPLILRSVQRSKDIIFENFKAT